MQKCEFAVCLKCDKKLMVHAKCVHAKTNIWQVYCSSLANDSLILFSDLKRVINEALFIIK